MVSQSHYLCYSVSSLTQLQAADLINLIISCQMCGLKFQTFNAKHDPWRIRSPNQTNSGRANRSHDLLIFVAVAALTYKK